MNSAEVLPVVARLREALEAGPTNTAEWRAVSNEIYIGKRRICSYVNAGESLPIGEDHARSVVNAAFIAAANPSAILALLNALDSATAREAELSAAMEDAGRLQKALTKLCQHFPIDDDMKEAGWDIQTIEGACEAYDSARHVLSALAGAVTVKAGEI